MADKDSDYEFYVGAATHLEGASLAIEGTARIDGKIVGKVAVKHLIVGPGGVVEGDISGETAEIEGTVEDSLTLTGKLTVRSSGRIRGKIQYGSIETMEGQSLLAKFRPIGDLTPIRITRRIDFLHSPHLSSLQSQVKRKPRSN